MSLQAKDVSIVMQNATTNATNMLIALGQPFGVEDVVKAAMQITSANIAFAEGKAPEKSLRELL